MPVEYEIDRSRKLIKTRCTGNLTLEEVLGHFRALAHDPNCPEELDVFLDLTGWTSKATGQELHEVTDEMGRLSGRVRFGACAVVVSSDVIFGVARMFVSYAGSHFRDAQVFRSAATAEEWLAAHNSPLR
jgi:hypothetical protein